MKEKIGECRMRYNGILGIIVVFMMIAFYSCSFEHKSSSQESPENYMSEYKAEEEKLPKLVFQLFYAVKDSLDYGDIQGQEKQPQPKVRLTEYSRVTSEFLESFKEKYQVEKYERIGDDYVLIVSNKANTLEKYKATRMEKFLFQNGKWISLGGYLYF